MGIVIWRLMAHHKDPVAAYKWMRENNRLALGWGHTGDLRQSRPSSKKELLRRVRMAYPTDTNISHGTASLWRFAYEIECSHMVIVVARGKRVGVFSVTGEYEWCDSNIPIAGGDYFHQVQVKLLEVDAEAVWRRTGRFEMGESQRWSFARRARTTEFGK